MLRSWQVTVCLLLCAPLSAADDPPATEASSAPEISYRRDVWPILKRHCWGCHSQGDAKGGLSLDTVAEMLTGGESGALFEPAQPDESLLLDMVTGESPAMPKQQPPLSAAKIEILRDWIKSGAADDSTPGDVERAVMIPDIYRFAPAVTSLAFSPGGELLAAACRSEVVLIPVAADQPSRRLPTGSDLLSHVEFSSDGRLLAAVGGSPAHHGEVRFFQPGDGAVLAVRRVGHDTLFRGSFAPDNSAIAVGGADGAAHLIPVDSQAKVRSFDLHSDWVLDVAYTPDGTMLVSGGRDKATKISSVETGELLRTVDATNELVSSVAADEKFAIGAGRTRIPVSYELKIALSNVEVSGAGNGARPVSKRAQYAKNFETQPGEIHDLALSHDRALLAVGGAYGEVRVYQVATRQRVVVIRGVPNPVYSLALNADGTRLAIGGKSGQVHIHSLPDGELIREVVPVPVAPATDSVTAQ